MSGQSLDKHLHPDREKGVKVTKPRHRRLEILLIIGEVPSQNFDPEINYVV